MELVELRIDGQYHSTAICQGSVEGQGFIEVVRAHDPFQNQLPCWQFPYLPEFHCEAAQDHPNAADWAWLTR